MFPHGAQKALGWFDGPGFQAAIAGFQQYLGIPPALTVLVIVAEFLGSLGLIARLLTRLSAFGIGAVMVGAVWLQHMQLNTISGSDVRLLSTSTGCLYNGPNGGIAPSS